MYLNKFQIFFKIGLITKKQTKQKRNKLPPFNAPTILAISLIAISNEVTLAENNLLNNLLKKEKRELMKVNLIILA